MIILGLTGSIGTGKSTTAGFFREAGIPVNDADQVVHQLYREEAVEPVGKEFPGVIVDGAVDRARLSAALAREPEGFKRLEAIVHPLVRARERQFLADARAAGYPLVVLDIPLLFESGATDRVDKILVVSCSPDLQRERVLARPGMTPEKFDMILSRQMPDAEKRRRADYVIDTGKGLAEARANVEALTADLLRESRGA